MYLKLRLNSILWKLRHQLCVLGIHGGIKEIGWEYVCRWCDKTLGKVNVEEWRIKRRLRMNK